MSTTKYVSQEIDNQDGVAMPSRMNNIAAIRKAKGMTQEALAAHLDLAQGHVSRMEHGKITISLDQLRQISKVLGCRISNLVDDVPATDDAVAIARAYEELSPEKKSLVKNLIATIKS